MTTLNVIALVRIYFYVKRCAINSEVRIGVVNRLEGRLRLVDTFPEALIVQTDFLKVVLVVWLTG